MTNLHNIVVYIKDEAMLEEAREILLANGQEVEDRNVFFMLNHVDSDFNYLRYSKQDNDWWIGDLEDLEKYYLITLPELEKLLKQKRDEKL